MKNRNVDYCSQFTLFSNLKVNFENSDRLDVVMKTEN